MKILILNWRDIQNPMGGGAEVYLHEIAKRWVQKGHEVTLFCSRFPDCLNEEIIEGVRVIRRGGRLSVYWKAYRFYKKMGHGFYNCVIDSINTIPFFTPFYVKGKRVMMFFQLAKEVWFYEAPFPLNFLGYLLEPFYLKFYRSEQCVTISDSSKNDLNFLGFVNQIPVFNPAIFATPLRDIPQKESIPTLIYVGRLKKSKRVHHILKALRMIQQTLHETQLWIVGSGDVSYENYLKKYVKDSKIQGVTFWGYVNEEKKMELMKKAHLILVASVREGWGMIVIEAAAMGTPAVVYDVPGLRDSVVHNQTGIVVKSNNSLGLTIAITDLLKSPERWQTLAQGALERSKKYNWDEIAEQFLEFILFSFI